MRIGGGNGLGSLPPKERAGCNALETGSARSGTQDKSEVNVEEFAVLGDLKLWAMPVTVSFDEVLLRNFPLSLGMFGDWGLEVSDVLESGIL